MNVKSSNQKHHMKHGISLQNVGIEWLSNRKQNYSNPGDNKSKQLKWQIALKVAASK